MHRGRHPLVLSCPTCTVPRASSVRVGLGQVAEEEGFIAVVPQGYRLSWSAGECCGTAARLGLDDVGLVRAIVDYVEHMVCIDRSRIFATGYSNGGYLSYRLACEASDLVRPPPPPGFICMRASILFCVRVQVCVREGEKQTALSHGTMAWPKARGS
jgi:predicted esterase